MTRLRLLVAMALPVLLVALAMGPVSDLRLAFVGYVLGGCLLGPWLLTGARPGGSEGLPFLAPGEPAREAWRALLVFGPAFLFAYWILRQFITAPEPYLQALHSLGWQDQYRYLYFALFVACVPLAEEWWWRGQALPRAEAAFGATPGRALVALAFSAYHLPVLLRLYPAGPALIRFAGILFAGFVWTWIAARRRSWGWVWWAHLAADAVIVVAFILWVQPSG